MESRGADETPATAAESTADGAGIACAFRPSVELISVVREFVNDFSERVLHDADTSSRLATAVHELLENSLKYSTDGAAELSVSISRDGVWLTVKNRITAERAETLKAILAELEAVDDRVSFYVKAMAKSATRTDGSGLGLARIFAEGEMVVRGEFVGDTVAITVGRQARPDEPRARAEGA